MAAIMVYGDRLEIRLSVVERTFSLKPKKISIDRAVIANISITDEPGAWIRGVKKGGLGVPAVAAYGTWKFKSGKDLYFISSRKKRAVVIDIKNQKKLDNNSEQDIKTDNKVSTSINEDSGLITTNEVNNKVKDHFDIRAYRRVIITTEHAVNLVKALKEVTVK